MSDSTPPHDASAHGGQPDERPRHAGSPAADIAALAAETGRTRATIAAHLRLHFPHEAPGKGRRWRLRLEHIASVRRRFPPR